jgi:hypothetical protein
MFGLIAELESAGARNKVHSVDSLAARGCKLTNNSGSRGFYFIYLNLNFTQIGLIVYGKALWSRNFHAWTS